METKTIHNNNISFVEVLAALVEFFTLCALFIIQGAAKTAKTAGRYARIVWRWLNTRHLFGDDSEAVTLSSNRTFMELKLFLGISGKSS